MAQEQRIESPLVTVGIVVLNREWIIEKVLASIAQQSYPHKSIYIIIVDGKSEDRTVHICNNFLKQSDFKGFEIIETRTSIPEGRNICIERMKGNLLLFWDSDVIMDGYAIENLVTPIINGIAEIVHATPNIRRFRTKEEAYKEIKRILEAKMSKKNDGLRNVVAVTMGNTMILRSVFDKIRFDPEMTILEDLDFSVRAREIGMRLYDSVNVQAYDINVVSERFVDIYTDMPLSYAVKGLKKKARVTVLSYDFDISLRKMIGYFVQYRRNLVYLGYIPTMGFSFLGYFNAPFYFIFPAYLLVFMMTQIIRRGVRTGIRASIRSLLIGMPMAFLIVCYFLKYILQNKAVNS